MVGDGNDDEHVCVAGVSDEDLGAVQHPAVILFLGNGLLALCVGAGARLGQAEGTQPLAAAQLGQVLCLLLRGTVLINRSSAQAGVSRNDDTGGAANLAQLFHSHDVGQHIAAGTAHRSGEIDAHHAQLAHLLDGLLGEVLFCIDLLGQGLDFVFSKLAVHLLHHLLLLGQSKIHRYILLTGLFSFAGTVRFSNKFLPTAFPQPGEMLSRNYS